MHIAISFCRISEHVMRSILLFSFQEAIRDRRYPITGPIETNYGLSHILYDFIRTQVTGRTTGEMRWTNQIQPHVQSFTCESVLF